MRIANETNQDLFYNISSPGMGDCGTIKAHQVADLNGYDNKTDVSVSFSPLPNQYIGLSDLKTTKGNVLTIAMNFE